MKISLEWISEYVDISDLDSADIAHKLTMSTAEVEGMIPIKRAIKGVVVGEITEIEDIPDSEKLTFVTVDCGDKSYKSVCGAPNVSLRAKSAFAPIGVVLADDFQVTETEFGGYKSEGVLCSAKELGFSEFHEGIFEIPASVENGTPLTDLIPETDTLLEIDNKSLTHRPDLWGHYGIAREVAAIYDRKLKPLNLENMTKYRELPEYPVIIEDLENCPAYCCIAMENIEPVPSPLFMQYRLHALGQRTFDLLVDLTNYIMFELGQPTHAFDGSKLQEVRIAPLAKEATFTTLDGQERKMLPEDLMIWNEEEPVAIAGVMGGENSEVGKGTKKLLLESANFKGSRIRRTATRLGMRTEASVRFEKDQPPMNARLAISRFLYLIHDAGLHPKILTRSSCAGNLREKLRYLEIPMEFFNKRVGMIIPEEKVVSILQSIGFEAKIEGSEPTEERLIVELGAKGVDTDIKKRHSIKGNLVVGIPPHRSHSDISIPEDIIEEVTRIYGFDNIQPEMPEVLMSSMVFNDKLRSEHKIRKILATAQNFIEVHCYSWFDERWLSEIGFEPGETLELDNPSSEFNRRLRTTLIPNLLSDVKQNILHRDEFQLFEFGHVYFPKGDDDRHEFTHLAGVSFRQSKGKDLEEHFRSVKGAVEDVLKDLNLDSAPKFITAETTQSPWMLEGNYVNIQVDEQHVGNLGVLPADICEMIGVNTQVIWFELEFEKLIRGDIYPEVRYDPPSIYPGSWLDFSIVWETDKGFAQLEKTLDKFSHPLLQNSEFLYLYKGKGLEKGKGSYTFRYWIGSKQRTLRGDEIDAFKQDFLEFLETEKLRLRG